MRYLPPPRSGEQLRIGYLSTDFFQHPTALLVAGVLEQHDRTRHRVYAFSTGPDDVSALRERIAQGVATRPVYDAAATARALERAYAATADQARRGVRAAIDFERRRGLSAKLAPS